MRAKKRADSVEKIGGTSMARTEAILENVLLGGRTGDEVYGRIFVVSAYAGITDMLLMHKRNDEPGVYALFAGAETEWVWGDALSGVEAEMCRRNAAIFADEATRQAADHFVRERVEGVRSCLIDLQRLCSYGHFQLREHLTTVQEMLTALGEAHSAHNTSLLLRSHGVDAAFVDLTGWRDERQLTLDERIETAFRTADVERQLPIVSGYANCKEGLVSTFGRGYTEVTFSRVAVLTGAREAIIHKEFHLSSADPRIVGIDAVRTIGRTNYDVADQLSNLGMEAIHPHAAKGLRQAEIPLRVRNSFEPNDPGTTISGEYRTEHPRTEIVTGLKGVLAFAFFEPDMVGVKGYDAAILAALQRHCVRIVSKTSNANSITHYLCGSMQAVKRVEADLAEKFDAASITTRKVAIVSAIGSDLNAHGLTATAVAALDRAEIGLLGLHQSMRNVDIQFVIDESDFERAVRALHAALIEADGATTDLRPSAAA